MSSAQYGTSPHRSRSSVRCWTFGSYRTIGRLSVGATFQLGAKFGVGYSGGIRNAILISETSVSSLARPHIRYLSRPHTKRSYAYEIGRECRERQPLARHVVRPRRSP